MLDLEIDPEARLGAAPSRALPGRCQPGRARDAAARAGAGHAQRRAHPRDRGAFGACGSKMSAGSRARSRACATSSSPTGGARAMLDASVCAAAGAAAAAAGAVLMIVAPARLARRFRRLARAGAVLARDAGVAPDEIVWQVGARAPATSSPPRMPRRRGLDAPAHACRGHFLDLAEQVICHRDPERFGLLYRLLLAAPGRAATARGRDRSRRHRAEAMARAVRRDMHKMTAFVRFREVADEDGGAAFVAWFEPEHHILERARPFFVERFATMRWSILTPRRSLHWDGETLRFAAGATTADAPARRRDRGLLADLLRQHLQSGPAEGEGDEGGDADEVLAEPSRGRTDFSADRRCGRRRRRTMVADAADAAARAAMRGMARRRPRPNPTRRHRDRDAERGARGGARLHGAAICIAMRRRPCSARGRQDAPVMFVGEQPGDQEDLAGKPFVGPAGQAVRPGAGGGRDRPRRGPMSPMR